MTSGITSPGGLDVGQTAFDHCHPSTSLSVHRPDTERCADDATRYASAIIR